MANGTPTAPGLSFPRETFAKLTPGPFLQAHLKRPSPIRPNGRTLEEFRKPTINTGSLTHSNGSAVVRVGDTAVVCGVRAEILLASDLPQPPTSSVEEDDLIEELGLLVPNLELSTGCSPAHLPGNPPGTLAQSLSYRILTLLHASHMIRPADLRIEYTEPRLDDDEAADEIATTATTKAYWVLYIDILCIALDGNPFDAAWAAVVAALQTTVLPQAGWDADRELILCSPHAAAAHRLTLNSLPIASTFAVFSTSSPLKRREEAESWILADPDGFEDECCQEHLTIVLTGTRAGRGGILRLEKKGGPVIHAESMRRLAELAESRRMQWEMALRGG